MKNGIRSLLLVGFFVFGIFALPQKSSADEGVWKNLGDVFGSGASSYEKMVFNPSTNEPYVLFKDDANSGKLTLMRFNGSSWVLVGSAGFSDAVVYFDLAFNPQTNEPYVVFTKSAMPLQSSVMKYNGTSWVLVGGGSINTSGAATEIRMAFNAQTNEPYVALNDVTNSKKMTVVKFNGSAWVIVGAAGFTSAGYVTPWDIAFNPQTNEPYVAYIEAAGDYVVPGDTLKINVMKYNGSSWVLVGSPEFSRGAAFSATLEFNPQTNELYVAYRDDGAYFGPVVKKFNGTDWIAVGIEGFSASIANYLTFAFNPQTNEPWVAYEDYSYSRKVTAKRFNGVSWETVGVNGFSPNNVLYTSIAFNPQTNVPYIAFQDALSQRASVMVLGVSTPTVSVNAGTYDSTQSVTLSSVTSGSAIYYTTDGSIPTASSTQYIGPISVSTSQTIKAIAVKDGIVDSDVMSASYMIKAIAPVSDFAAGTYERAQSVTLSSATSGATIYYTTNGDTPTAGSTQYTGAIEVASSQTIKAIAVKAGIADSDVLAVSYVIKVATPISQLTAGVYTAAQTAVLLSATTSATIYYTTNGDIPTVSSTQYTGPITVSSSQTIKAIGISAGMDDSDIMSVSYTIKAVVPSASPAAGTYNSAQAVTLSSTTAGATIYYTTNGSVPTTGSNLYSGPIAVGSSQTIKAIAVKAGMINSNVVTAAYIINIPAPPVVVKKSSGSHKSSSKKSTPSKSVSVSKKTIARGGVLIQRGKKFSKNSFVLLYASRPGGGYYPPQRIRTAANGSFLVSYRVNKPAGAYSWYVIDQKTGKRSKTVSYKVK